MLGWRLLSSLLLWGLVVALVALRYTNGVFLLIAITGLAAQREFYLSQQAAGRTVFMKTGLLAGALLYAATYFSVVSPYGRLPETFTGEAILVLLVILGALTRRVFDVKIEGAAVAMALTLFGFFYVPYLLNYATKILFCAPDGAGIPLLAYAVAITKFTDVGAYVAGSLLGRHKLSPLISPKKTWEGLAGGVVMALCTSVGLVHFFPVALGQLAGFHAWVLGFLLAAVSVIGDLGESVVKRDAHVKDSGTFIPGIGGALDLVDSLLFSLPVFYGYLILAGRV
ncbi:MAG: phosphatidate cytidylyltransferase [Verrucomicrobia bacterium]|nr:phosphatidate cytidylyltransferase [bacterium]NDA09703.1 phosphatidate cytidylyltransferase [Verrucomicrobiota bacterium]NDA25573.1 phosphatidate cytidylyltransferase [Verrucomicrobiota bacterium]NDD56532.1 phosphatidate cytidylyltransferase [Verrucomicrobiota bacterium]NDD81228.1 phosphatidate cytidylyltransferase [Verrucomicrobiota bacterium]